MAKRKSSKIMSAILVACALTTSVFAATSSSDVTNDDTSYGSVFLNAKSSSIYAETSASSSGVLPTDCVQVSASHCETTTNTGKNYTTAWTSASGSFSGSKTAAGTIVRDGRVATGATSADA